MKYLKNRHVKKLLWACLVFVVFPSLLIGLANWYINSHKKEIVEKIVTKLEENISGEISVKDVEISFWRSFPRVSLVLQNIAVSDSLDPALNRPLLRAEDLLIKLGFSGIKPTVAGISIENATIKFFTDSTGYGNQYILSPNPEKKKKKELDVPSMRINLKNVAFELTNPIREKHIDFTVLKAQLKVNSTSNHIKVTMPISANIRDLAFRTSKGGFVKNQTLKAVFKLDYDKSSKKLEVEKTKLDISGEQLDFEMIMDFSQKPSTYRIIVKDPKLPFKKGLSFINKKIADNFKDINVIGPIDIKATIKGNMVYGDSADAIVSWNLKNCIVTSDYADLKNATMSGLYTNYYKKNKGNSLTNSALWVYGLKATVNEISFEMDSCFVQNLENPFIRGNVRSKFNVKHLNPILDETINIKNGDANVNVSFEGSLQPIEDKNRKVNGSVEVKNAAFTYTKKNLSFEKSEINLVFDEQDVLFKKLSIRNNSSIIDIKGKIVNAINAVFDPEAKALIKLDASSDYINLKDFGLLLVNSSNSGIVPKELLTKKDKNIQNINNRIATAVTNAEAKLNINIKEIKGGKFTANNIESQMTFLPDRIDIVSFNGNHAGGHLRLDGRINPNIESNPFEIKMDLTKMHIDKIMYAFDNFGMESLKSDNIEGQLTSKIKMKGKLDQNGGVLPKSLEGNLSFNLKDAVLKEFGPFMTIKKFVFKKRRLEYLTFATIKNNFRFSNGKVYIPKMTVKSSALELDLQGVYAFDKGTDISLEIPIRNPQKDLERIKEGKEPREGRGIVLYLRTHEDEDGNVSIRRDFRRKEDRGVE